jgi:hypothetical protein
LAQIFAAHNHLTCFVTLPAINEIIIKSQITRINNKVHVL